MTARQLVLCRLADRIYGIELATVREIITFRGATRLPGAPALVAGLVNVRGTIVTVLDLGERLAGASSARPEASVVLVEHGPKVVGVVVDEVLDVHQLADDAMPIDAADLVPGAGVRGVVRLEALSVVLLDISGIISHVLA